MLPDAAYAPGAVPKDHFQQKYCDPRLDLESTTLVLHSPVHVAVCHAVISPGYYPIVEMRHLKALVHVLRCICSPSSELPEL